MLGPEARDPDAVGDGTPRTGPVPQRDDFTMTPPFTPSRWSSDSPHAYNSGGIGINQKLDRVLLMFDEMKQQVERDSVEMKEQLSNLHDDLTELKEKYQASVSKKAKKKTPCDVSVRFFIICSVYVFLRTFLVLHSLP